MSEWSREGQPYALIAPWFYQAAQECLSPAGFDHILTRARTMRRNAI